MGKANLLTWASTAGWAGSGSSSLHGGGGNSALRGGFRCCCSCCWGRGHDASGSNAETDGACNRARAAKVGYI
eukprot:1145755-Pelagomonas_calceolata.AAC.5